MPLTLCNVKFNLQPLFKSAMGPNLMGYWLDVLLAHTIEGWFKGLLHHVKYY